MHPLQSHEDFGSTAHQQMEGVTAKLCQIEKQAETIKDTTLHSNRFRLARLAAVSRTKAKIR